MSTAESQPWVERYRPKSIDEVASQQHAVNVLRKALTSANLPHMLFYGPPGTGKTSTILALARQLYGPELMRSRVLELNASDERGISVVRDKIKSFARAAVSAPNPDYPSPPYKIVILDEADSMTQDAQGALRRIMEQYSRITRFCLVCNYVTRIIEPVASRCSKFRFRPLDVASTEARLLHIAQMEGLRLNPDLVPVLIRSSEGDMRRSITYLQSIARLASARGGDVRDMSPTTVSELAGAVPTYVIQSLARAIGIDSDDINDELPPRATGSTDFDVIERAVRHVVREGYSSLQVVLQLHDYIISHPLLSAKRKTKCALHLGATDKSLMDGGEESLQLLALCLALHEDVIGPP